jgi:hypothetical protein
MLHIYPPKVDTCNPDLHPTIGGLRPRASFAMPASMSDHQFSEIGSRLKAVREVFSDMSQKDWASAHHFEATQWNNWEKGVRRIPIEASEKLCLLYGLSLDWIYLGRKDGLSQKASKSL